jgi:DNA-binding response OmpR family regulator
VTGRGANAFVEEALSWLPEPETGRTTPATDIELPLRLHHASEKNGKGDRPRVLVADDNADMRQYVVRLLPGQYQVEAAPDGTAALAAARARRPDLILTDVMMPRLDGFGLLRELRTDPRTQDVPVILLSARAGEESRVDGKEAGADDYLVKPFGARELLARVSAHLQMARLRREASETLPQSQERLRIALTAARMVAWEFDPTSGRVVLSDNAPEVLALPPGSTLKNSD